MKKLMIGLTAVLLIIAFTVSIVGCTESRQELLEEQTSYITALSFIVQSFISPLARLSFENIALEDREWVFKLSVDKLSKKGYDTYEYQMTVDRKSMKILSFEPQGDAPSIQNFIRKKSDYEYSEERAASLYDKLLQEEGDEIQYIRFGFIHQIDGADFFNDFHYKWRFKTLFAPVMSQKQNSNYLYGYNLRLYAVNFGIGKYTQSINPAIVNNVSPYSASPDSRFILMYLFEEIMTQYGMPNQVGMGEFAKHITTKITGNENFYFERIFNGNRSVLGCDMYWLKKSEIEEILQDKNIYITYYSNEL